MKRKKKPLLKALQNAIPSYGWMERPEYKKENRRWLQKSFYVALEVLDVLDEKKMTQVELAAKLGVSRQQVSKILQGQENLALETISKLEVALDIKLGKVLDMELPGSKTKPKNGKSSK